jgi:isopentenyl-diphosphate delta-isomerase
MEKVILVDPQDNAIGTMEKMEAHKKGLLHRAFSVVIFNSKGEMLIQKRAHTKYHSAGLWTNACCSHPMPGEAIEDAHFAFKFTYKVSLDHGLIEHEVDHVFTAVFDGSPSVNPDEVADWKFVDLSSLKTDVRQNPQHYTYWFSLILDHSMLKQKI